MVLPAAGLTAGYEGVIPSGYSIDSQTFAEISGCPSHPRGKRDRTLIGSRAPRFAVALGRNRISIHAGGEGRGDGNVGSYRGTILC